GNNGGDGLVCARLLRRLGRNARVLLLAPGDELRGDALANYERLEGDPPEPFDPAALDGSAAIVDAILGTGVSGEAREPGAGASRPSSLLAACSSAAAPPASRVRPAWRPRPRCAPAPAT